MNDRRPLVLVVDDEPVNIEVMAETLDIEFDVICAASGTEALSLAADAQPDLIFLDVIMPGVDGYEVCGRLKADPRTSAIPVIFVTALEGLEDEERGLRIGAIDYVTKPIRPPIVRARARNQVELKRARDQLATLARVDGLTGLANRRAFDTALERECLRHLRQKAPMALLLADIDHFKRYNDAYGHVRGDHCLRRVAAVLREATNRPADLTARYGGEEFACVLPDTPAQGARAVAERLRHEVLRLAIPHAGSPAAAQVTVSIGGVAARGARLADPAALVEGADRQLYLAKAHGRNRVLVADTEGSTDCDPGQRRRNHPPHTSGA